MEAHAWHLLVLEAVLRIQCSVFVACRILLPAPGRACVVPILVSKALSSRRSSVTLRESDQSLVRTLALRSCQSTPGSSRNYFLPFHEFGDWRLGVRRGGTSPLILLWGGRGHSWIVVSHPSVDRLWRVGLTQLLIDLLRHGEEGFVLCIAGQASLVCCISRGRAVRRHTLGRVTIHLVRVISSTPAFPSCLNPRLAS